MCRDRSILRLLLPFTHFPDHFLNQRELDPAGMVVHSRNLGTQEADAGESL